MLLLFFLCFFVFLGFFFVVFFFLGGGGFRVLTVIYFSVTQGWLTPQPGMESGQNLKFIETSMDVLVTCKNEEDNLKRN